LIQETPVPLREMRWDRPALSPYPFIMKILHTVASLDPASGGPARSVPQLALALAEVGHEVGLWSPEIGDRRPEIGVQRPVTEERGVWDRVKANTPRRNSGARGLADLGQGAAGKIRVFSGDFTAALADYGVPDLVHDHGIWLPCHREVAKECQRRGISRITSPRGMLEPWALNHKKWKKKLAWWLYQRRDLQGSALLHATAESESDQLHRLGLLPSLAVIPNGVAVPKAPNVESWMLNDECNIQTHEAMAEYQVSYIQNTKFKTQNQTRTALFLSRIHPKKGLPLLLEAWAKVKPDGWQLRIMGPDEGGHVVELKRMCQKLGLRCADAANVEHRTSNIECRKEEDDDVMASYAVGDNWARPAVATLPDVEFSGPLEGDEKWAAFRDADLFILPTHSENFGIAVAEAMAAGLPVITTHGAPWELLEQENCGWWVPVSAEGIAAALDDATRRSPEELALMGARGRAVVAERFSWDRIAQEMIACYEWVLGGSVRPDCVRN